MFARMGEKQASLELRKEESARVTVKAFATSSTTIWNVMRRKKWQQATYVTQFPDKCDVDACSVANDATSITYVTWYRSLLSELKAVPWLDVMGMLIPTASQAGRCLSRRAVSTARGNYGSRASTSLMGPRDGVKVQTIKPIKSVRKGPACRSMDITRNTSSGMSPKA